MNFNVHNIEDDVWVMHFETKLYSHKLIEQNCDLECSLCLPIFFQSIITRKKNNTCKHLDFFLVFMMMMIMYQNHETVKVKVKDTLSKQIKSNVAPIRLYSFFVLIRKSRTSSSGASPLLLLPNSDQFRNF